MSFEGLHEDGSDKLTVEAQGPAIYWDSPEGGEFGFYDLNLNVSGDGAFYGSQATSDYYDIKSLNFYNCNVSAKNNNKRKPTIGYFGDLYLKDCYLFSEDDYLDDVNQCVCDGNGHIIYDNIRIMRGERGDEPTAIGNAVSSAVHTHSAPLYDLQGRRLNSKPDKPGIYILDGKKVVMK